MSRQAPQIFVGGTLLDPNTVELPLTITFGRGNTQNQPDAPVCQFKVLGETVPFAQGDSVRVTLDLPTGGTHAKWGDPIVVWAAPGNSWSGAQISTIDRFVGRIESLKAIESGGQVVEWEVGCVGNQTKLGTRQIDIARPQETEHDRVAAICAAADNTEVVFVGSSDVVLAADNIYRDALSALHEVASWTGALVVQTRDGKIGYGFANHREEDPVAVLPESAILDGIEWSNNTNDVLNHVVVTWVDNGVDTQNTYRDDASIAEWGFRHVEVSTKMVVQSQVDEFGNTLLLRRSQPFWSMPGVVINSVDCSDEEYWQINLARVSSGVTVKIPVEPGDVNDVAAPWTVEGWVETWNTADNQTLQLYLSDRQRWGAYALRRWSGQVLQPWSYWVPYTWLEQLTGQDA